MTLEQLYEEYKGMVYNLALQYVQNQEDAEEITQDVFLSVHQSIGTFKEQSKHSTWIYRITINKSLDYLKAKQRKKRFAFITSFFHEGTNEIKHERVGFDHPGVLLEHKESLESLFREINQLPDNQKNALILSKIENKSQQEIAEIMNSTPKAVESMIQRAKTNLSKKINKSEG